MPPEALQTSAQGGGEIEAEYVYALLARRERDPQRADVLRRIARAETRHRHRIEQRMREQQIPVPDASTVRLPLWLRLQSRVAPVDRLLSGQAAMIVAAVVSLVAHFRVGAAKSLFTLRRWWAAGLEMTFAGILVGAVLYGLGVLFKVPT